MTLTRADRPTYLPTEGRQARRAELTYLPTPMLTITFPGELCNVKKYPNAVPTYTTLQLYGSTTYGNVILVLL